MQHLIDFLRENQPWTKIAWYMLGMIGLFIMSKTRSYFYKNKSYLWWIVTIIAYWLLGPAIFIFSLVTLIPIKRYTFEEHMKQQSKIVSKQLPHENI